MKIRRKFGKFGQEICSKNEIQDRDWKFHFQLVEALNSCLDSNKFLFSTNPSYTDNERSVNIINVIFPGNLVTAN